MKLKSRKAIAVEAIIELSCLNAQIVYNVKRALAAP